jgi:hypothetical protein
LHRAAGLIFTALLALAMTLLLLAGRRNPNRSVESRQANEQHKHDTPLSRPEPETVG